MAIENWPEAVLNRDIDFYAGLLAGGRAPDVRNHIFRRLLDAGGKRVSVDVRDLVVEIEAKGIVLSAPEIDLADESRDLANCLFLLQRCPSPLPVSVLEQAVESTPAGFCDVIDGLIGQGLLLAEDGLVRLRPLTAQAVAREPRDLAARALTCLVTYIRTVENSPASRAQVRNVLALAEMCASTRPRSAINVFRDIQTLLKAMGDKRLILRMADLSIEASTKLGADEEAAKARALTLICGKSWVYQRTGRLSEALLIAEKSLALGDAIPWPRNTAFCMKCIGRIYRMLAEQENERNKRATLLQESIEKIQQAIDLFERLPERGARSQTETGDCHSLLGRTYLVCGRLDQADLCIRNAFELIPVGASKDHMDLKILAGDLESARKNFESAESHYSDVLKIVVGDDSEKSEILARAHLGRGFARRKVGRTEGAKLDFADAHRIWSELGEGPKSAEAEWELIRLTTRLSGEHITAFEPEPSAQIRVRAFRVHEARLEAVRGALALKSRPPDAQISNLLDQARKEVAMEPEW